MSETWKRFSPANPTITKDVVVDGSVWLAVCTKAQTYRLFEVPEPGVEDCQVLYRAKLKTEGLTGKAYLEMWCRLPARGAFFSRGAESDRHRQALDQGCGVGERAAGGSCGRCGLVVAAAAVRTGEPAARFNQLETR
jgi:hypothetical protein